MNTHHKRVDTLKTFWIEISISESDFLGEILHKQSVNTLKIYNSSQWAIDRRSRDLHIVQPRVEQHQLNRQAGYLNSTMKIRTPKYKTKCESINEKHSLGVHRIK